MPPGLCLEGDSGTIGRLVVAGAAAAAPAADGDDAEGEKVAPSEGGSLKLDLKGTPGVAEWQCDCSASEDPGS